MPEINAEELSINQLRTLVEASAAENAGEPETPATTPVVKTPPPASEPATQERNPDGTFVTKAKADDETVSAGVQKRIDKAVKAQREAERQRDEALARVPQVTPPAAAVAATAAPAAPKQEDFTTYDEYSRAIARWEARQEINAELATQREANVKAQGEADKVSRAKAFGDAEVEARKANADYDEVTSGIEWPKAPGTSAMADYILDTNNAALYYALGRQPAELARIAAMAPIRAIAALAKFEAKLEAPPAVTETPVKPLPKPPKNVGGGSTPTVIDLNDPKVDMRTFKREFSRLLKANAD